MSDISGVASGRSRSVFELGVGRGRMVTGIIVMSGDAGLDGGGVMWAWI